MVLQRNFCAVDFRQSCARESPPTALRLNNQRLARGRVCCYDWFEGLLLDQNKSWELIQHRARQGAKTPVSDCLFKRISFSRNKHTINRFKYPCQNYNRAMLNSKARGSVL